MFSRLLLPFATLATLGVLGTTPLAAQNFTFSMDPVTIPYDPATGVGSTTALVRLGQNIEPGVPVIELAGFSLSYSHDPALLNTTAVEFAGVLLNLNGGTGPGLGSTVPYEDGATTGAVFNLVGAETISFFSAELVLEVTLQTNPSGWIGNTVGGTVNLTSPSPASSAVPVDDVAVNTLGQSIPAAWFFPVIDVVPIGEFFIRGDSNGDGTVTPVADAITTLNGLFGGAAIPCASAADVNADGTLNIADAVTILNYGFAGGPPPPAPFPNCGLETISTTLTCDQTGC